MKHIFYEDNIIVFIYKNINEYLKEKEEIEENIKKILINIKKNYKKKISGYYKIKIYQNKNYGIILEIEKEEDFDFFPDVVDLKVELEEDSDIYLKVDDYFLINDLSKQIYTYDNNYYINVNELEKKEIILLSDFYKLIYGKELEKIKNKFKTITIYM